jgi:hypothetical protein
LVILGSALGFAAENPRTDANRTKTRSKPQRFTKTLAFNEPLAEQRQQFTIADARAKGQ